MTVASAPSGRGSRGSKGGSTATAASAAASTAGSVADYTTSSGTERRRLFIPLFFPSLFVLLGSCGLGVALTEAGEPVHEAFFLLLAAIATTSVTSTVIIATNVTNVTVTVTIA